MITLYRTDRFENLQNSGMFGLHQEKLVYFFKI